MSITGGINWAAIRGAVRGWVLDGAGADVAADHVIWDGQQRAIPSGMYITIGVVDEREVGFDRTEMQIDGSNNITEHAIGDRLITIRVTVFGAVTERDARRPWLIASRIRGARTLSKVVERNVAANCAIVAWTKITTPGVHIDSTAFEPRAMFDVDLSAISDMVASGADAASVIQTVNGTGKVDLVDPAVTFHVHSD